MSDLSTNPDRFSPEPYPHFMLKEIYQQPEALQTCFDTYCHGGFVQRSPNSSFPDLPGSINEIRILASGTSRHAGLIAQDWLESFAKIPTRVYSSPVYLETSALPPTGNTLIIGVTQSGETADTLQAVAKAKQDLQGNPYAAYFWGMTNHPDCSLANHVDAVMPTLAGPEKAVAATKTFTTQLMVFALLTVFLSEQHQALHPQRRDQWLTSLKRLPDQLRQLLQQTAGMQQIAQTLANANHCIILGWGANQAIALEGALKFKETTYLHAEGYAAGEFMHGPIALLDRTVPVIAILPNCGIADESKIAMLKRVKSSGSPLIGIVMTSNAATTADLWDAHIELPNVPEFVSPLLTVVPLQLLAYFIAVARGLDPDRPRNLTKTLK